MNMHDVSMLLQALQIKNSPGPLGVEFKWYFEHANMGKRGDFRYRVESGSGIAGRGRAWGLVRFARNEVYKLKSWPKVTTKRELRRQVLEELAEGQRPNDHPGVEVYARWHTYGLTSSIQWFSRRRRKYKVKKKPKDSDDG